jgi:hypothetical protein
LGHAGIARNSKNPMAFDGEFPGDGVFAASAADDKDFHGEVPF